MQVSSTNKPQDAFLMPPTKRAQAAQVKEEPKEKARETQQAAPERSTINTRGQETGRLLNVSA